MRTLAGQRNILGEVGKSMDASHLAIYITTRNQRVVKTTLQTTTNKIDAWTSESCISFSLSKTVIMAFRKREGESVEITLRKQITFLGMTLDYRLN